MNRFALDFAAFLGSATLCALVSVATITSACQSARVVSGSGKVSQARANGLESRPQDGLGQPVNTGRHIGGKRLDLHRATRGVAGSSPDFERSSSPLHNVVALGEAGMASARGVHHEPGLAASPGGRAGAYPSSRTIERVIAACGVCGVPVGIGMRLVARESGFRQVDSRGRLLVSSAGAVGIGQIKPSSAAEVSPTLDVRGDEWQNLVASMCYLSSRRGTWREKVLAYRVGASGIRTAAAHAYASHVMGSGN